MGQTFLRSDACFINGLHCTPAFVQDSGLLVYPCQRPSSREWKQTFLFCSMSADCLPGEALNPGRTQGSDWGALYHDVILTFSIPFAAW